MSKCYVVGVDGREGSIRAVQYASSLASKSGAALKVIHVLEWSPYSFLTPEELDERHARRADEVERAKVAILDPIINNLGHEGVETEVRYGHVAETICEYSGEVDAEQVFISRHGGEGLAARLFGSVPATLVQISKIPVTVIP